MLIRKEKTQTDSWMKYVLPMSVWIFSQVLMFPLHILDFRNLGIFFFWSATYHINSIYGKTGFVTGHVALSHSFQEPTNNNISCWISYLA